MPDKEEHKIRTTKLDEILKILNGNGKTGLCAKVNLLWGGSVFVVGAVMGTMIF